MTNKEIFQSLEERIYKEITILSERMPKSNYWAAVVGVLSIIVGLGVSLERDIILYWIPSSFLLLSIWLTWGCIKLYKKSKGNGKNDGRKNKGIKDYKPEFFVQVLKPFFNSISIVFIITSFLLTVFITKNALSVIHIIPFFVSIVFIISPFVVPKSMKMASEKDYGSDLRSNLEEIKIMRLLIVAIIILLLILVAFPVFPILSVYFTYEIVEVHFILLIMLAFQFISIIFLSSFFSREFTQRFISNKISELRKLRKMVLRKIDSEDYDGYESLKQKSEEKTAFYVKNSGIFKFLPFYLLKPETEHLGGDE